MSEPTDGTSGGTAGSGSPALPAAGLRLAVALSARPLLVVRRGGAWLSGLGRVGFGRDAPGRALAVTAGALSGLLDDAASGPDHPLPAADAAVLRHTLAGLAGLLCGPAGAPTPPTDGPGHRRVPAGEASARVFTAPGADGPGVPFDTGARDAGAGPVRGRDVAAAPGAVVLRTPSFELLQYLPVTERVHAAPVLIVPPLRHRYWLADLAPGYSLVEHLLARGLQVFAVSRHPDGPADPAGQVTVAAEAVRACTRIAREPRVSLLGVHTGGRVAAALRDDLVAAGDGDRVVAVAHLPAVPDGPAADDGPDALPRPVDGAPRHRAERALRAWAADRLPGPSRPAAPEPDRAPGAGSGHDEYRVVPAGTADPLPDRCGRLVVAPGVRAGALVAAPELASAFRAGIPGPPEDRLAGAERIEGSWWDDLAGWLTVRSGELRDAPPELGGRRLPPLFPAPGTYLNTVAPGAGAEPSAPV
ncbi:alpha/beta hydrolase [Pseudonocardia sp. HH130630-07]|uniref:alpha/beta hydrolase n=1 Tax=Pseudonocardia sp. HH130630-07 TaxID=1690815 RepID=UPI000814F45C|nr:alpha/beta hydrolase [Pseudonocardia sp. HH130630-07]ANY08657.1 hypothetical protein AFB00_23020 [Pseudonocardia sp. HH130630-07]